MFNGAGLRDTINDLTFQEFDSSVVTLIEDAKNSAAGLVNLLVDHFDCFKDEGKFDRKSVRLFKKAQIFVADLWAAFDGEGYGKFDDIDKITMFAGTPSFTHKWNHSGANTFQTTASRKCCIP